MTDASYTIVPITDDFLFQTIPPSALATEEYCSIPTMLLNNFTTVAFENTKAIRWMHEVPPRYGKPNSVLLYITGTAEQQTGKKWCLNRMASLEKDIQMLRCKWLGFVHWLALTLFPCTSILIPQHQITSEA